MKKYVYILVLFSIIGLSCKSSTEPETPEEKTLTITYPNGGESILAGSNVDIKWTSNSSSNVKIEYSADGGIYWNVLTNSTTNDGSFSWTSIPSITSYYCKIRITTTDTTKLSDESDAYFYIVKSTTKSLSLIQPKGGERLLAGKEFDIKWEANGLTNIKLDLSTDNGSNWTELVNTFPADSSSYTWKPDLNFISTECLLKISDVNSDTLFEITTPFSISLEQTIVVSSPNGSETWESNTSKTITWFSQDVETVKIEYTTDNGVNWNLIIPSTQSDGFYTWNPIPSTYSNNARIRISDALDNFPSDVSDTVFSISPEPSLTVISPNGGEYWLAGTSQYIKWSAAGNSNKSVKNMGIQEGLKTFKKITSKSTKFDEITNLNIGGNNVKTVTNVKIEFSINNGATWNTIVESTANNGFYLWNNVPTSNSALCRIRVSDASDGTPFDESDNTFVIYDQLPQDIVVVSPNGGESWEAGSTQNVTWNSSGVASVKIEYTTNNGVNWTTLVENTPSDGFYTWSQIPNFSSTNCKIRVSDATDGSPIDESNGFFSISPEPEITVLSPNGGESYLTGTTNNLTWTSTNVANVKIEYTTNGGAEWIVIAATTPSDGVYEWTNIPNIYSNLCKIRISDVLDGVPFDISNSNFVIYNQVVQFIELTSPNGGEQWEAGTGQIITWSASGINNVKIEYTTNNGLDWNLIVNNLPSTGAFEWNVPDKISTQCKVRISDAADGQPIDESNSTFRIKPVPFIKVLGPNGGEVWTAGEIDTIRWTSIGVENVKIESSIDNGLSWDTVASKTPSDGSYEVSFSIPSKKYKIKVRNSASNSPMDESDGTFTVLEEPYIQVISPNGGENWLTSRIQPPSTFEIKWVSFKVDRVKIEYTLDNGYSWNIITEDTKSNGIYNWTIPENITHRSDLCKVRITSTNGNYSDISDGLFTIHPQEKLLRLTFPNGGETVPDPGKNSTIIKWISAGISKVKLELSLDNGMQFDVIVNGVLSTGAYEWEVPPVYSALARIRITDASSDAGSDPLNDMSDSYFGLNTSPTLKLVSPDGVNKKSVSGSVIPISWLSPKNIQTIKIEYSIDNGKTWNLINENIPSKPNQLNKYSWQINQKFTKPVLFRVSDSNGQSSSKSKPVIIK